MKQPWCSKTELRSALDFSDLFCVNLKPHHQASRLALQFTSRRLPPACQKEAAEQKRPSASSLSFWLRGV